MTDERVTREEAEKWASPSYYESTSRMRELLREFARSYLAVLDENAKLRHAAEQASLILFACKGPREAFKAKELLDAAIDALTEPEVKK